MTEALAMAETFVLVHGAWHGAWCWGAVQNQLEARGDRAFAVDLPGHGQNFFDRAKVTLKTYVDGVTEFIERRNLSNVVLAGHSMGGLVISGVTARIPERIKRTIFVTAFVMNDGERPVGEGSPQFQELFEMALKRPDRSLPIDPIADLFRTRFIQDGAKELQDFVLAALSPQPVAPLRDPVPMKDFFASGVPSSYLACEDDLSLGEPANWHPRFSSRLKTPTIKSIKAGHELMFTRPIETAEALFELARS
jgi:pimeloyl-ACP methyl ester carboxylesterase